MQEIPNKALGSVTPKVTAENIHETYSLKSFADVGIIYQDSYKRGDYKTTVPLSLSDKRAIDEAYGIMEQKKARIDAIFKDLKAYVIKHMVEIDDAAATAGNDVLVVKQIVELCKGSISLNDVIKNYTEHKVGLIHEKEDEKGTYDPDIVDAKLSYFSNVPVYNKEYHDTAKSLVTEMNTQKQVNYNYTEVGHVVLTENVVGVYCLVTGELIRLYDGVGMFDAKGYVVKDISHYIN